MRILRDRHRHSAVALAVSTAGIVAVLATAHLPARPAAGASNRTAALLVPVEDRFATLAEQATEVVIAAIAAGPGGTIIGTEEFRGRLGMEGKGDVARCLSETACSARAAVALGVSSIVLGFVGGDDEGIRLNLQLIHVARGTVERQLFREFPPSEEAFLKALPDAVREVFTVRVGSLRVAGPRGAVVYVDDRPAGTAPIVLDNLAAGPHRVRVEEPGVASWEGTADVGGGNTTELSPTLRPLDRAGRAPGEAAAVPPPPASPSEKGTSLVGPLGLGAAGLGLALLAGGGVLNYLAMEQNDIYHDPATRRADAYAARDKGKGYFSTAVVLYGTGAALAATGGVLWFLGRGDAPPARAAASAAKATLAAAASSGAGPGPAIAVLLVPGGALLSFRVEVP